MVNAYYSASFVFLTLFTLTKEAHYAWYCEAVCAATDVCPGFQLVQVAARCWMVDEICQVSEENLMIQERSQPIRVTTED